MDLPLQRRKTLIWTQDSTYFWSPTSWIRWRVYPEKNLYFSVSSWETKEAEDTQTNNYGRRLRRWHNASGKYTRLSRSLAT